MSVAPTPAPRQFPPLGWFGTAIPASYQTALGISAQSITVYNNSPANLAVFPTLPPARPAGAFPWGGIIVPAFYPQNIPVSGWTSFAYATDGTLTFALSSLVVFISEAPGGAPLSPFGPSGWGAGNDASVLTQINPGDPILAWQLRQYYLYLTGQFPASEGRPFVIVEPRILTTVAVGSLLNGGTIAVTLTGLPSNAAKCWVRARFLGSPGLPTTLALVDNPSGQTAAQFITGAAGGDNLDVVAATSCQSSQIQLFTAWNAGGGNPTGVQFSLQGYA